ncbi:MAG: LacI family DNA-binding transcriptional regulator [Spirochaetales bacterium]|nr:LacI family DNA-binding transcriptional regulator [Spirochaetales bacterium]
MFTIKDIAKEAGVSTATVSRVLNNKKVRKDSQENVEAAIKKLDYRPNVIAQGLIGKTSRAIGVMITSMTNSYYMEITETIEKRVIEQGAMMFLCSTKGDHLLEKEYLYNLMARRVDGIIIIDPSSENHDNGVFKNVAQKIPMVFVHSYSGYHGFNIVSVDQYLGMRKVMDYLWSEGHRDIAFLRGANGFSYDIKEKCWRDFLKEKGAVPLEENLVVIADGNSEAAIPLVRDACSNLLKKDRRPSAIFACNDLMASAVISAAGMNGVKVPDELTVIGHDNTVQSQYSYPPLSTVDLKLKSLGNTAMDLLAHAMNPEDPEPRKVLLEPDLIIRASSSSNK